jgi:hypothetical protein
VLTLLVYGCPVQAVVPVYQWDERTIQRLQAEAGGHCQAVHEHRVKKPRDLGMVQVDESWVKMSRADAVVGDGAASEHAVVAGHGRQFAA